MAEESSTGERTEDATAKRRNDFREKGQVAQSKDVHTAAIFTIVLLFWVFYLPVFFNEFTTLLALILQAIDETDVTAPQVMEIFFFLVQKLGLLMAPLFFLVLLIGFFSSFFQIGWLFTTKPFQPDISKFDPIKGMGRIFSKKSIVELIKSILKIVLIAWVAYSTVLDNFEQALVLVDTSIPDALTFLARTAGIVLAKICAILIFLAFIDLLFVRYEMEQKMKMTKQEVKEEFKESEGDPLVKSQIRAIQRQMARRRMMAEVPGADVVITNPTHLSIAIRYDSKEMEAPMVIAKGAGVIAMNIRAIARENNIPIIENPPVARLLHKIDLGGTIPEELFKAVAEILAHVYTLKGKKA
ncbi:MAG: flagellar biosynthesis protein FlhB [Desulfopila sp.]|jgi:flagellar biosynthetic protein FlhB|nr:flagellar biosynthesis protein FlhB [Desulfopila sp.]